MHKRPPEGTVQARVFRALKAASLTATGLSEATGIEREIARKSCTYLARRGCIVRHRIAARLVIYAAAPRSRVPTDRRGKHPNSRNQRGASAWASWLLMMTRKHGGNWRPPIPGTLDQLWPRPHA